MSVTIKKSRAYLKLPLTQYLKVCVLDCGYLINTLLISMVAFCTFIFSREQILFGFLVFFITLYLAKIVGTIYLEKLQEDFTDTEYVLLSRRERVDVINEVELIVKSLTKDSAGMGARYKGFIDDTFRTNGFTSVWEDLIPLYFTRSDTKHDKEIYFALVLHSVLKDIVTSTRFVGWSKSRVLLKAGVEHQSYLKMPSPVQNYIAHFFPDLVFLDPLAFSAEVLDGMKAGMAEYMNVLIALQESSDDMINKLRTWYEQPPQNTPMANALPTDLIL